MTIGKKSLSKSDSVKYLPYCSTFMVGGGGIEKHLIRQVGTQAAIISEKMAMTGYEDEKID